MDLDLNFLFNESEYLTVFFYKYAYQKSYFMWENLAKFFPYISEQNTCFLTFFLSIPSSYFFAIVFSNAYTVIQYKKIYPVSEAFISCGSVSNDADQSTVTTLKI